LNCWLINGKQKQQSYNFSVWCGDPLYNGSKLRTAIEERGGKSVTFPDLADRVSDDLYSKRISIAAALKEFPLGNWAELSRWRGEVKKVFDLIVG
jgi:hypothetical protein